MEKACSAIKRYNHLIGEIEGIYHDISFRMGLSDSVSKILYTLCISDNRCPLSLVCRQTGLSKQTVNSAIRRMEEQGLVKLAATGRKSKDGLLTDDGKELADRTARRIIEMENSIFGSWKQEDVQHYLFLTEEFLHALQSKSGEI